MSDNNERQQVSPGRTQSDARIVARTQLSSSGVIIERRQKSTTDVIRKSSNSRILE